ncbi:MAG: His/Gly/Thr/Pro-type tRNA ligase C-terminal domain-containing protein, partial [Phycisphaerales bacterium]|nr:His/Gly/Thr/Pro-type tRNA ligase C-terminal domain-containing protein [Phycisphaerales bacterium]
GLIMTHADDDGLVLPPRLAPAQVVIIPITFKADDPEAVMDYCRSLAEELKGIVYAGRPIGVEIDDRDIRGGEKTWSWVKKGVPIRLEIGPRDMAEDSVFMARRDRPAKEKQGVPRGTFLETIVPLLDEMQQGLYDRALAHRTEHTREIDSKEEFYEWFTAPEGEPTPIHAGFAMSHFCGDREVEERIKSELGVTVLCEPLGDAEPGTCPFTGQPSPRRVFWGKSY